MFSNRVRFCVMGWLIVSVAVFVVRLGPVLARYRADEQKFADLAFEAKQPSPPPVVNDPNSPTPNLTLSLQGRAIRGLDDGQIPWMQADFRGRDLMLVAYDTGRWFRLKRAPHSPADQLLHEFPKQRDLAGRIDCGAIAGPLEGRVIATVGEFPVVQFWDMETGKLLETVEDEHPTMAARPVPPNQTKRHPSGLRYSETDARRIVAAPRGCLFAIGKVDGTIELWGDLVYREHPEWIEEEMLKGYQRRPFQRRFGMLSRRQVHEEHVVDLKFCKGGLQLLSIGGHKVTGYAALNGADGSPLGYETRVRSNELVSDVVLSSTSSLDEVWRQKLPEAPDVLAIPMGETVGGPHWKTEDGGGIHKTRPFAISSFERGVLLGDLLKKELTGTLAPPKPEPTRFIQSIAFHRNENALLTLHTDYSGQPGDAKSETILTLWQVGSRRRIATARLPGQFMSAGWDSQGMLLALLRFDPRLANSPSTSNASQGNDSPTLFPWRTSSAHPHMFHLWDVRVDRIETPAAQ